MCLIIKKEAGAPCPANIILTASETNPHGWGFMTTAKDSERVFSHKQLHEIVEKDTKKTKSNRINSIAKLIRYVSKLQNKTVYIHLRKCTAGSISKENNHPLQIGNTGIYLMHNGTMRVSGIGDDSDTVRFLNIIKPTLESNPELIYDYGFNIMCKQLIGNGMVVFLTPDGREIIMGDRPWIPTPNKGIYLSNLYSWKHYR